jgi:hypothetical protein
MAAAGDASQARQSYQECLTLWKDADADLPLLIDAKREASHFSAHEHESVMLRRSFALLRGAPLAGPF